MGAKHKQSIFLFLTLAIAACSKSKDAASSKSTETPPFNAFDTLKENQIDRLEEISGCTQESFEVAFSAVIEELAEQKGATPFLNTPSLKAISIFTETKAVKDKRRTENPPRPVKDLHHQQISPSYGTGIPVIVDVDDLSTPSTFVDYRVYMLHENSCTHYYHEVFSYHASPKQYLYRGKVFFYDRAKPPFDYDSAPPIEGVKVSVVIEGVPIDHLYSFTDAEGEFVIETSNVRLTGLNNVQLLFEHPEYQNYLSGYLHAVSDSSYQRHITLSH